jgi:hypothetical protein
MAHFNFLLFTQLIVLKTKGISKLLETLYDTISQVIISFKIEIYALFQLK